MSLFFQKIINNPFFYFSAFIKKIINYLCFPFRICIYKKVYHSTFISLKASIHNHKYIVIGKNSEINCNVILWPLELEIGNDCQINPGTAIYGKVKIGNSVMIAPNCMIAGGNHNFKDLNIPMRFQGSTEKGIYISDNVWIGANSVILDGVTIEEGVIVGAGSVVTTNLLSKGIYFGNPATFKSFRNE